MKKNSKCKLLELLVKFRSGEIKTEEFCTEFERIYNFELNRMSLTDNESMVFKNVFEEVVWYSPYLDERKNITNYRGEDDIARIVEIAIHKLRINGNENESDSVADKP